MHAGGDRLKKSLTDRHLDPGPAIDGRTRVTSFSGDDGADAELARLDEPDRPAVTMGQAAQLLGVRPAFLRSLDAAGVLTPQRSRGGHRRYSRRQLELAARLRELFDEGMTLDAATRIVALQDALTAAREQLAAAREELGASQARELDVARTQFETARERVAELEARSDASARSAP
jgi:MerR family transcriptional regulator, heat shock protein HspR